MSFFVLHQLSMPSHTVFRIALHFKLSPGTERIGVYWTFGENCRLGLLGLIYLCMLGLIYLCILKHVKHAFSLWWLVSCTSKAYSHRLSPVVDCRPPLKKQTLVTKRGDQYANRMHVCVCLGKCHPLWSLVCHPNPSSPCPISQRPEHSTTEQWISHFLSMKWIVKKNTVDKQSNTKMKKTCTIYCMWSLDFKS